MIAGTGLMPAIIILVTSCTGQPAETDPPICGTVVTSQADIIHLYEGEKLSDEEFRKVHINKMKGAIFRPNRKRKCSIQICGFTSYRPRINETLIGSQCDYDSCLVIDQEDYHAPSAPFNSIYNTSSLSCACEKKDEPFCFMDCEQKAGGMELAHQWKDDQCALLFPARFCDSCHFKPIVLTTTSEFKTDTSTHISSILVREKCLVQQDIPAFKNYFHWKDIKLPRNYTSDYGLANVVSAYDSEPERFWCKCNVNTGAVNGYDSNSTQRILQIEAEAETRCRLMMQLKVDDKWSAGEIAAVVFIGLYSTFILVLSAAAGVLFYYQKKMEQELDQAMYLDDL